MYITTSGRYKQTPLQRKNTTALKRIGQSSTPTSTSSDIILEERLYGRRERESSEDLETHKKGRKGSVDSPTSTAKANSNFAWNEEDFSRESDDEVFTDSIEVSMMTDNKGEKDDEGRRFIHFITALKVPEVQGILRKALEPSFKSHIERFIEESDKKYELLSKRMDAFEERINHMNCQDTRIKELEETISDLLQEQRNANLIVKGIKSKEDNEARTKIMKIINEEMSAEIHESEVLDVIGFTIRRTKEKVFRIWFRNTETRAKVYKARLKLNKTSPVWFNEDLHPFNL